MNGTYHQCHELKYASVEYSERFIVKNRVEICDQKQAHERVHREGQNSWFKVGQEIIVADKLKQGPLVLEKTFMISIESLHIETGFKIVLIVVNAMKN